jgi:hypothetical protein
MHTIRWGHYLLLLYMPACYLLEFVEMPDLIPFPQPNLLGTVAVKSLGFVQPARPDIDE